MKKCGLVADMVDGSRPSSQCHQGMLVIGHQLRIESTMAGAIHIWHHFIAALQVIDGPRGSRSNPIDYQGKAVDSLPISELANSYSVSSYC